MNMLISTFHFRLHNSTAHLSNVLKLLKVLILFLFLVILTPLQQYFSYIMATSFSGGRSRSTKPGANPSRIGDKLA